MNALTRIGICDDGENVCTSIENMLLQWAEEKNVRIDTNVWYTGEGLKRYLEAGNRLDILFLDIELFRMTGIEVGSYIRNQLDDMGMQIIYISGKASYAQQLFKTQPLDFLVKPISKSQISGVLETAFKIMKRKNEKFEFRQGKDYYYVQIGDIVYFASQGRKVKIVTPRETYEFYGRLREVAKRLPEDFITIETIRQSEEKIRSLRHDMKHHMNEIKLLANRANVPEIQEYIDKMEIYI